MDFGFTFFGLFLLLIAQYWPESGKPFLPDVPDGGILDEYDFIIVGAGSSGSVVANRLSEIDTWKILLIEAGGDENPISEVPLLFRYLQGTEVDWNYTTTKQKRACLSSGGICTYPRGHVLGGSSSINAMIHVRGNKYDYDLWEALGNPGWGFDSVLPYFLRSEDMREPSLANSKYHSKYGPLAVQYPVYKTELVNDFIKAGVEMGLPFRDYNGRYQYGISYTQVTMKGPSRCSTAKAFLLPLTNRKNFHILKRTHVNKVVINPITRRAEGVEFIMDGIRKVIKARSEVILSAGAINTPKILMLSGVGPKEHLVAHSIPVIRDLPVGQNLQDHNRVALPFEITRNSTITQNSFMNEESIRKYSVEFEGPLTTNGVEVLAFLNVKSKLFILPDVQFHIASFVPTSENVDAVAIALAVLRPRSVGTVRLQSSDPYAYPLIDPNYYSETIDFDITLEGLRKAIEYMNSKAMKKYSPKLYGEFAHLYKKLGETSFLKAITENFTSTFYHPVGTAKMGPAWDPEAVVSPELQVYGIKSLRVIDASIMPRLVSGNTNAACIMIGEKGADIIKRFYGRKWPWKWFTNTLVSSE